MRYTISGPEGMLFHWKTVGGEFVNKDTLNDTIYVNWKNPGDYKLSVIGEFDGCFTDEKFLDVTIRKSPVFSLEEDRTICLGDKITF